MDTSTAPASTPTSAPSAPPSSNAPSSTGNSSPDSSSHSSKPTSSSGMTKPGQTPAEQFEIKVNGKAMKLSREELIRQAQLGYSATERFEQSAKQKREVEEIIGSATKSPIESLMKLGLSKEQLREAMEEWYTREYIEPETLTPEQRKNRELEAELKKYRTQEEDKAKVDREKQAQELTAKHTENYQKQIIEALESSGLPKSKFVVQRLAFWMRQNLTHGWEAPMDLLVEQVKKDRLDYFSDLLESSDPEVLSNFLGDKFVNKLRKHDLQRLRARRSGGVDPSDAIGEGGTPEEPQKEKGSVSYREVNRRLRLMAQGKKV